MSLSIHAMASLMKCIFTDAIMKAAIIWDIEEIYDEAEYDSVVEAYESIMEEDEWNELLGYDD